jgi:hypothetical protein
VIYLVAKNEQVQFKLACYPGLSISGNQLLQSPVQYYLSLLAKEIYSDMARNISKVCRKEGGS